MRRRAFIFGRASTLRIYDGDGLPADEMSSRGMYNPPWNPGSWGGWIGGIRTDRCPNGGRAVTDEQAATVASMTEGEMIEVMVAMRKRADEQGWIWEDIEELADQEYCGDFAARLGRQT